MQENKRGRTKNKRRAREVVLMMPKYENTLAYAKATGQVPLEDHEMMYFADWLRDEARQKEPE